MKSIRRMRRIRSWKIANPLLPGANELFHTISAETENPQGVRYGCRQ